MNIIKMPDGLKISGHLFGWQLMLMKSSNMQKIQLYMITNLRMVEFESHTEALKTRIIKSYYFFS